jgi:hypothetical protein
MATPRVTMPGAHDCPINKAHHTTAQQRAGCHNGAILPIHLLRKERLLQQRLGGTPNTKRLERFVIDADSAIDEFVVLR